MTLETTIETDVLVIGGGIAGCFAALKAKDQGLDVVLVDKGLRRQIRRYRGSRGGLHGVQS